MDGGDRKEEGEHTRIAQIRLVALCSFADVLGVLVHVLERGVVGDVALVVVALTGHCW